jgi:hypothetical protein
MAIINPIKVQTPPCIGCGNAAILTVPAGEYAAWIHGVPIQQALPMLSVDEREQLITGTCPACWSEMFDD